MTTPADQPVTLPTGRLLLVAWIPTVAVGGLWALGAMVLGRSADAVAGLAAAGLVAVAATLSILVRWGWRSSR